MFRRHGDPEATDPSRKGCGCQICDGDIGIDRFLWAHANEETGHQLGCECDACDDAFRRTDPDDVREEAGCKLAGFSAEAHQWARTYQRIDGGYLDPARYDCRYIQVAEIGDTVTAQAQSDRMPDTD
jgi:hypothetical protein